MKICQRHWDAVRKAIDARGIGHLGAKTGEQAVAAIVTELEGRGAENDFDPLMSCNTMIFSRGLEVLGLAVMGVRGDGSSYCPVCEALRLYEEWWIEGPAEAALAEAKKLGVA